jgi:hypothetical protein
MSQGTSMNESSQEQTTFVYRITKYVRIHRVSLGLFLAAYGTFYLSSVLLSRWTIFDWGKDITGYPQSTIHTLLPRSFIGPIFFVTSFPALVIGSAILCVYSIRRIGQEAVDNKEKVAVLLTAFGFTYQVIGAWPLEHQIDFPWQWQKQIVANGTIFAWILYILSLIVLVIGAISLYKHSRIYHQKHSIEEEQNGE